MKKILLTIALVGVGIGIAGITFADYITFANYSQFNSRIVWDNSIYTSSSFTPATSETDSFTDGNNTCYVLVKSSSKDPFGKIINSSPIGISCLKN